MTTGGCSNASTSGGNGAAVNSSDTPDIPNQLAQLSEGWLELESDPGLFSSLISDFGCRGVQVEEIYDLEKPFTEQLPGVYGFIFLFNVIEERRNRIRGSASAFKNDSPSSLLSGDYIVDEEFLNEMFFAYQKVPNSCATHAILSVLMNCNQISLGPMLSRLKEYTRDMNPENKGYAISNMAELARAHNNHAAPTSTSQRDQLKQTSNAIRVSQRHTSSCEAFHFVSFVPINGRLIELDGLKELPIDHGLIEASESWTEKFRKLMRLRIETQNNVEHDIRYNLMAVIPSRYEQTSTYLRHMNQNRFLLLKIIQAINYTSKHSVMRDHNYTTLNENKIESDSNGTILFDPRNIQIEINNGDSQEESKFSLGYELAKQNLENDNKNINNSESFPLKVDKFNQIERPESPVSTESTKTASRASSQYNHQFSDSEEYDNDDCDLATEISNCSKNGRSDNEQPKTRKRRKVEHRFVVCKFQSASNERNSNSIDHKDANSSISPTSSEHDDMFKMKVKNENICQNSVDQSIEADQNIMKTLLQRFKQYSERSLTYSEFERLIKPYVMKDLIMLINNLDLQIRRLKSVLNEEQKKKEKFRLDDTRRIHDYDNLITTFLAMFFEQGLLDQVLSKDVYLTSVGSNSTTINLHSREINVGKDNRSNDRNYRNNNGESLTNGTTSKRSNSSVAIANGNRKSTATNHIDQHETKLNAESMISEYENSLFFPSNFQLADSIPPNTKMKTENDDSD